MKDEATPEMIEMANRCALGAWPHDVPVTEPLRRYIENAALAAIIETTKLAAEHLDRQAEYSGGYGDLGFAARLDAKQLRDGDHIRAGYHYGKDEAVKDPYPDFHIVNYAGRKDSQ